MTNFLVVSTSMTLKDPELKIRGFYWFLWSLAAVHSLRMNVIPGQVLES